MTRPLHILLLLCLACFAPARAAWADRDSTSEAKARRHYERGQKLFTLQQFDKALDQFQRAFDADPIPDFLFNIGQCQRNLGDREAAIFSFKQYLKLKPDASNRESVEELIQQLEEKQAIAPPPPPPPRDEQPPPSRARSPFYKKWWFWTGVAVVGAAGGVAVYAATSNSDPNTDLGIIDF